METRHSQYLISQNQLKRKESVENHNGMDVCLFGCFKEFVLSVLPIPRLEDVELSLFSRQTVHNDLVNWRAYVYCQIKHSSSAFRSKNLLIAVLSINLSGWLSQHNLKMVLAFPPTIEVAEAFFFHLLCALISEAFCFIFSP